jgi:hypothetical protein
LWRVSHIAKACQSQGFGLCGRWVPVALAPGLRHPAVDGLQSLDSRGVISVSF